MKHPRGSLPWDIHKFVSDSPHGLDIFFRCNLPQFLADISDDTEYRTSHINRLLLPDCLIDLFFRIYSPWLTSKIRQGMKFVILCQRNFLPLIRCLVAERVNTESGILKNLITLCRWFLCIEFRQKLLRHFSSWIRGSEDDFDLFHSTRSFSNLIKKIL